MSVNATLSALANERSGSRRLPLIAREDVIFGALERD